MLLSVRFRDVYVGRLVWVLLRLVWTRGQRTGGPKDQGSFILFPVILFIFASSQDPIFSRKLGFCSVSSQMINPPFLLIVDTLC